MLPRKSNSPLPLMQIKFLQNFWEFCFIFTLLNQCLWKPWGGWSLKRMKYIGDRPLLTCPNTNMWSLVTWGFGALQEYHLNWVLVPSSLRHFGMCRSSRSGIVCVLSWSLSFYSPFLWAVEGAQNEVLCEKNRKVYS